jgi:hypothetical protein
VDVRPEQPIRELDHCVSEVDDRVARERPHVDPLRVCTGWENLQPAEAVEEDRDAAEVGVFA